MFFEKTRDQKLEQDIHKHKQLLNELLIRSEALDKEIHTLFEELEIKPQQITTFISDSNNFTPENWEELQKQRQQLNEKLKQELENIPDPQKSKKALAERNIDPRWLFVR